MPTILQGILHPMVLWTRIDESWEVLFPIKWMFAQRTEATRSISSVLSKPLQTRPPSLTHPLVMHPTPTNCSWRINNPRQSHPARSKHCFVVVFFLSVEGQYLIFRRLWRRKVYKLFAYISDLTISANQCGRGCWLIVRKCAPLPVLVITANQLQPM